MACHIFLCPKVTTKKLHFVMSQVAPVDKHASVSMSTLALCVEDLQQPDSRTHLMQQSLTVCPA